MKNIRYFLFLIFLALPMLTTSVMAQESDWNYYDDTSIDNEEEVSPLRPESMVLIDSGIVTKILRSNLILLNNKRYKLDNISTPVYEDILAFDEVKKTLLNKKVTVYSKTADRTVDRYKIPLSHVVRDDGFWIQEHLISNGLAWATITGTNRKMLKNLLLVEEKARISRKGFWATPMYDIKTSDNLDNYINSYQIIEGKILYASQKRRAIFFNFSKNWKTDFTIELPNKYSPRFNTNRWLNNVVRVRGWVKEKNGPMISLKYPEQIEIIK